LLQAAGSEGAVGVLEEAGGEETVTFGGSVSVGGAVAEGGVVARGGVAGGDAGAGGRC